MTDLETRSGWHFQKPKGLATLTHLVMPTGFLMEMHSEKDSPTPTAKGRHWLKDSDLRKPMEMHSATDFRSHSDLGLLTHLDSVKRSHSARPMGLAILKPKATG